jgi:hypothetical protein
VASGNFFAGYFNKIKISQTNSNYITKSLLEDNFIKRKINAILYGKIE